jgi:hypothetical protein
MTKRYQAGGEIDAWCTKCRLDLLHRIVAVVAGEPKRVECETCHSQHNYRAPKSGAAAAIRATSKTAKPRTARAASEAKTAATWETQVSGKDPSHFIPFSIEKRFEEGNLISHKRFGQGCVVEVLQDGKINVLFREGHRLLVHARA